MPPAPFSFPAGGYSIRPDFVVPVVFAVLVETRREITEMELRNPKEFATRSEAARVLGVSAETLRRLERRNEGPKVVRVSPGKALYPNIDLVLYLKNQTRGSVGGAA